MKQLSRTQLNERINKFKDRKLAQVLSADETASTFKAPVRHKQSATAAWASYIAL